MKQKNLSWMIIVFLLIIFFPVGIILLVKKIRDPLTAVTSTKVPSVVGWLLTVIGSIIALSGISIIDEEGWLGVVIFGIIILLAGIYFIKKGKEINNAAKGYKYYVDIVLNQKETSIDNIASTFSVKYDEALSKIKIIIKAGALQDAYIDEATRSIILSEHQSGKIKSNGIKIEVKQEPISMQEEPEEILINRQFDIGNIGTCKAEGVDIKFTISINDDTIGSYDFLVENGIIVGYKRSNRLEYKKYLIGGGNVS